jgi:hypothetical protein
MISLDTETTGLDLHHGARPYFVSTCTPEGDQTYWEWDVDPLTREVRPSSHDLADLAYLIRVYDPLVLQNPKFDYTALTLLHPPLADAWDWGKVRDTLRAGHVLASNQPHDLTSMALHYLGLDIQPFDDRLKTACVRARTLARRHLPEWRTARPDEPDMPSVGEKTWKNDGWLPRAICQYARARPAWVPPPQEGKRQRKPVPPWWHEYVNPDHEWNTVLRDYALADAFATVQLWPVMEARIRNDRRGSLWPIYERMLKLPEVAQRMELHGVTISGARQRAQCEEYAEASRDCANLCVNIAAGYEWNGQPYALEMPRGGVNNSLRTFCFDFLKLRPIRSAKSKTAAPTLDKNALNTYLNELNPHSKAWHFVKALVDKRKRDTGLQYLAGYERYWRPLPGHEGWYVLHPQLNPTGTDTLRWSSQHPNEQNISKQEGFNLRACFGPAPGREWWCLDAKNIEARIPAYDSGEQMLIDLYERMDDPPFYGSSHLLNFSIVYQDIWEAELNTVCDNPKCCGGKVVDITRIGPHCKKKYAATNYQWCKNGGFAVQYGAVNRPGGGGTADVAFHRTGAHSLLEARLSNLTAHNQWCIKFANQHGYIETMPDASIDPNRGYPLLCTRTASGHILPTVPLNYRTQGTAMHWTNQGMIRSDERLAAWRREDGFDGWLVMQVHDEMDFDFPRAGDPLEDLGYEKQHGRPNPSPVSNLWRIREIVRLLEQGGKDIGVPTPVGIEYCIGSWADGVTVA